MTNKNPLPRLFTPGPTPLPESVRQAAGRPMIHHRGAAFRDLMHDATGKLKTLFQTGHDFVSLHVPLTPQTKDMIGRSELAQMKPSPLSQFVWPCSAALDCRGCFAIIEAVS